MTAQAATQPKADHEEIERGISLLFQPGDVVEVRIPKTTAGVVSGYFDDHWALAAAIQEADTKYKAAGVYYVLNQIDPALLGRAYNRLKEHAEYATADNNIQRRVLASDRFGPRATGGRLVLRSGTRGRAGARACDRGRHGQRVG